MINEADGFLITLISGRMLFIEENQYKEDAEGNILYRGNRAYEVVLYRDDPAKKSKLITLQKTNPTSDLHCLVGKVHEAPRKITWGKIYKNAITSKEKIDSRSFIYETIQQSREAEAKR